MQNQQPQQITLSPQELNDLVAKQVQQTNLLFIEQEVTKQVGKEQKRFIETFFGQVVLACVTAVATAYVTQVVFGNKNK